MFERQFIAGGERIPEGERFVFEPLHAPQRVLAVELTAKLRQSTTVDWQVRESVRAQMRLLIKRLLRKYKYPPEGQEDAVETVIKQAERLSEQWTGYDSLAGT